MKQGDKVVVEGIADAFRTGLNSGEMVRVRIGDLTIWIPADMVKKAEE